jgi:hypothetical protein
MHRTHEMEGMGSATNGAAAHPARIGLRPAAARPARVSLVARVAGLALTVSCSVSGLAGVAGVSAVAGIVGLAGIAEDAEAAAPAAEAKGEARKQAEALFNRYVTLEHEFDPAIADLYADTARIESRRITAGSPPEVRTTPAPQYKDQLRKVMPIAKRRRDLSFYTEVTYAAEGRFVRIRAKRYAEYKKFTSPVELLVGPGANGQWQIFEELSEAHPGAPPK